MSDQTTVQVTTQPGGQQTTIKTTSPAKPGVLDQALPPAGLLLLRLGVAVAAAFVAAALTQRTLLGKFQFKAGGVELDSIEDVATTTVAAIEALQVKVKDQQTLIETTTTTLRLITSAFVRPV